MSPPLPFAPAGFTTRNGLPESWHFGAAAVVTPQGRLVARLGDAQVATFTRSAAKPFQVLPLLLGGGASHFDLAAPDLALICASHGGTPRHTARTESLLGRGGFAVEDLLCGAHPPFDRESARRLHEGGGRPTALHNNCSGKHAGMLLACRMLGWPPATYIAPDHPLQLAIRDRLAELCGLPPGALGIGIDGCSVPAFRMPLYHAARGYAALADPLAAGVGAEVAAALATVVGAMGAEPEMVAGPGRFTTRLIEVTGGRVLGKEGAEGFYGIAVRGPAALGIAVKIADGGERCRDGVVIDVLRRMGALSGAECAELDSFYRPRLRNWRGVEVGEVVADVELEEV